MITAKVELTQPLKQQRQFVAQTGSGHHLLLDDAAGGTGPKPIELVAAGLAGCTAFDVVTILRQKYHQKVTGYEVRVEADQAERPPQVFTAVRIHHVVTGFELDVAALEEAIRLSEEKYCSVGAMVQKTASFHTTYEIVRRQDGVGKADSGRGSARLRTALKVFLSLAMAWLNFWGSLSSTRGAVFVSDSAAGGEYRAGEKSTAQGSDRRHKSSLWRRFVRHARSSCLI